MIQVERLVPVVLVLVAIAAPAGAAIALDDSTAPASCAAPCTLECKGHHRYAVVAHGGGSGTNGGSFVCRQGTNDFTIASCSYYVGNPKYGACAAQGEWDTTASGLTGTCSIIGSASVRCIDLG